MTISAICLEHLFSHMLVCTLREDAVETHWAPGPLLPTKAYTTLVPKFEKHPLFADFGRKNTPFSTEIADFDAQ